MPATCPRCRKPFGPGATYEDVPVDRCEGCGGIWLDEGELRPILRSRKRRFTAEDVRTTRSRKRTGATFEKLDPELPCAKCGSLMMRFQYAGSFEIVLDQCPGHGIWFDKDELEEVQMAVEEREVAEKLKDERPGPILALAGRLWKENGP